MQRSCSPLKGVVMSRSLKEACKSLTRWLVNFRQDFYPTHQKAIKCRWTCWHLFFRKRTFHNKGVTFIMTGLGYVKGRAIVIRSTGIGKALSESGNWQVTNRFLDCIHVDTVKSPSLFGAPPRIPNTVLPADAGFTKASHNKIDDCPFLHRHLMYTFVEPFGR